VQDWHTVVAYSCYAQTQLVEFRLVTFQLHELGFAERSPIR
jgi:hypothetical protein